MHCIKDECIFFDGKSCCFGPEGDDIFGEDNS